MKKLGLFHLTCAVVLTLLVAGVVVPNLIRTESSPSLSTMSFAGFAVSYNLQNVFCASMGEVVGTSLALVVSSLTLMRKTRPAALNSRRNPR